VNNHYERRTKNVRKSLTDLDRMRISITTFPTLFLRLRFDVTRYGRRTIGKISAHIFEYISPALHKACAFDASAN